MTGPDPRLIDRARRDALRVRTAVEIQSRFDALLGVLALTIAALLWCLAVGRYEIPFYVLPCLAAVFAVYMAVRITLLNRRLNRDLAKIPVPHDPPADPAGPVEGETHGR